MSNPEVKCSVDPCAHWLPGGRCAAANIDVLDADAQSSDKTRCHTFILRSSVANMLGAMDNVNWGGAVREPFEEGRQLSPSVTCTVEDCRYWSSGDHCDAEDIHVIGTGANTDEDTNCSTFESQQGQEDNG